MDLTAKNADRHELYELSVQQPEIVIGLIEDAFDYFELEREPVVLREDFCGTAYLSSMWVRSEAGRRAVGVDIDARMIEYAEGGNRKHLGEDAGRLALKCSDVFGCRAKADVLVSLNFSHFIYKRRADLVRYLRHAWTCVKPGGVMALDAYGGPGAMVAGVDRREFGDFDYLWEQASFDALTNGVVNHIHFEFGDGTRLEKAFTYDWRLWSPAELAEAMGEAGFEDMTVWYEGEDGFVDDEDLGDAEAWVAYMAAVRR